MSAELIMASLLNAPAITNIVGTRRALGQLPQNTAYPALVYQLIDDIPRPNVSYKNGAQRTVARIQINPLAGSIAEVKSIHAAIRSVIDFKHHETVAGKLVVSCRLDMTQSMEKDIDSNIWTQPADYILSYYE
jgi:hypothetical protein